MANVYTWFTDPAHGWLRVPLAEVAGLTFSRYSYTDGVFAYLEEDCDADVFLQTLDTFSFAPEAQHTDEPSFIRDLWTLTDFTAGQAKLETWREDRPRWS